MPPDRAGNARERGLAGLTPAYFGLVMATGIVAVALHMHGFVVVARVFSAIAGIAFVVLAALHGVRIARHPAAVRADFTSHLKAPGFFTWPAASGVLGAQFVAIAPHREVAWVLWGVTTALWAACSYAIIPALVVQRDKPPLEHGINGAWLLAVVATQSVAVTSALLALGAEPAARAPLHFLALATWLAGGMLYTWIIALIFYRYLFVRLSAEDFTAPYWINMGAMAISALAGSLLLAGSQDAPLLQAMRGFIAGVTILCWATATWWIPVLGVLVAWRYGLNRYPLRYDPAYWSAVFPLGMYSAATHELSLALPLPFLAPLSTAFLLLAVAAWAATALGLLRNEFRG